MKPSERIENYLLEQEIKSYIEAFPFMTCLLDMDLTNKQTVLLFKMIDQENIVYTPKSFEISLYEKYEDKKNFLFIKHIMTLVDDMVRRIKLQVFA
jgi:hypothetical protein